MKLRCGSMRRNRSLIITVYRYSSPLSGILSLFSSSLFHAAAGTVRRRCAAIGAHTGRVPPTSLLSHMIPVDFLPSKVLLLLQQCEDHVHKHTYTVYIVYNSVSFLVSSLKKKLKVEHLEQAKRVKI